MRGDDSASGARWRARVLLTPGLLALAVASAVALRSGSASVEPVSRAFAKREATVEPDRSRALNAEVAAIEPVAMTATGAALAAAEPESAQASAAVDPPALPDPARFASREQERQVLVERLPGERLTLTNQSRALERLGRALDSGAALEGAEHERLREQRDRLSAKHELQARRVANLERRIREVSPN
jgi:hypothetical protein